MMQLIDPKLDAELCEFICGWHALEKRLEKLEGKLQKEDIIDMSLSKKQEGKKYSYRFDVLEDIERFLDMKEIKAHPLISRKMNSHRYYLQKQMGAVILFDEYLQNTMGVKPVIYSENKIQTIRQQTDDLLAPYGLKVEEGLEDKLNEIDQKLPAEEIASFFNAHHKEMYNDIKIKLGLDTSFKVKYSEINKEKPLNADITGDGRNYKVVFNMYHMGKKGKVALGRIAAHELSGHAVQFSAIRKKYDQGELPRYMTYIPTHESAMFAVEGLAETVQDFFPDMFQDPLMKAVLSFHRLRRVVANNSTTMANRGENIRDCVENTYKNCPNFSKAKIAHMLSFSSNKPRGSSYSQIYSQGMESFKEISESHPNKFEFIKSAYENFLMPEEIQAQTKRSIIDFV